MTMNPLPPQAYTKDILLKAYQWLMGQNTSLKEMATTPDILVSLYLKATRDGDHALDRPSIQNFKNELRTLAGMMGELDRPAQQGQKAAPSFHAQSAQAPSQGLTSQSASNSASNSTSLPNPSATSSSSPTLSASSPLHLGTRPAPQNTTNPAPSLQNQWQPAVADVFQAMDPGTLSMIHEVKENFNLSSELEALRMLVKIGYTRAKTMLP